ncbi:alpha/beta hydrolase [Actinoplanes sp. NPDC049596]|uniref:alpha/beta hydrolase n=1 Tax=unclassified Actinoplanes TaxID=2626549 RepID=UPI00344136A9
MRIGIWLTVLTAVLAVPALPSAAHAAAPVAVWGDCPSTPVPRDPRTQCATVPVPLDYRRPDGPQISVAISRIPATGPAPRQGVLLLNSGGPGGAGLELPSQLGPLLPAEVRERFDLIGFDPRGAGHSSPVTCAIPAGTARDLIRPYPAPDGSIDRNVEYARETARGCAEQSGHLLPFITTANRARDLDRIRQALAEPALSYLGYSYGTYLGAVYATLFPRHTGRVILDSAIDPRLVWYDVFRTWAPAVAQRLPDFTEWAAARDTTYHLGPTPADVAATYRTLAGRLDRTPVTLPGGLVVNGNTLREMTRTALYSDSTFPALAQTWQALATPSSPPSTRIAAAVPADNATAAEYAVVCGDVSWPRDVGVYARNTALSRRLFPATAGMPANVGPCAFWPNRPVEPPVTVTGSGPRGVLVLQNRRDPVTPWTSGRGMRDSLGRRAALVTVDQGGHGVYLLGDNTCANAVATAFLTDGDLPAHDRLCPGNEE